MDQTHEPYKRIAEGGVGEIVEKKSRFICTVRPVATEEEAAAFIEEMRKKYWDASHNCPAFVIGHGSQQLTRCSDDGEPSGTAGRPMLEMLLGEGLRDVCVVVTRYFGGTLLGTGGLVRAYQGAVRAGLDNSLVETMYYGARMQIVAEYTDLGKIQYLLRQRGLAIENEGYSDKVSMEVTVPAEEEQALIKEIVEATAGRLVPERLYLDFFAR